MNTTERKEKIISKLKNVDDSMVLDAVLAILESSDSEDVFELTGEQLDKIEKGRKDLNEGRHHSHDIVMQELNTWLDGK